MSWWVTCFQPDQSWHCQWCTWGCRSVAHTSSSSLLVRACTSSLWRRPVQPSSAACACIRSFTERWLSTLTSQCCDTCTVPSLAPASYTHSAGCCTQSMQCIWSVNLCVPPSQRESDTALSALSDAWSQRSGACWWISKLQVHAWQSLLLLCLHSCWRAVSRSGNCSWAAQDWQCSAAGCAQHCECAVTAIDFQLWDSSDCFLCLICCCCLSSHPHPCLPPLSDHHHHHHSHHCFCSLLLPPPSLFMPSSVQMGNFPSSSPSPTCDTDHTASSCCDMLASSHHQESHWAVVFSIVSDSGITTWSCSSLETASLLSWLYQWVFICKTGRSRMCFSCCLISVSQSSA